MITTTDLAKQSGLSTKTLTRWADQGILTKPKVSTHPSGRGKIGYWPDSALERCQKIQEYRKEGHDLETAVLIVRADTLNLQINAALDRTSIADLLSNKKVSIDDYEASLMDVLLSIVAADLKKSVVDRDSHNKIISAIRQENILRVSVEMIQNGINPFLIYDGEKVRVEPDFLLSHVWEATGPTKRSMFIFPLFPPLRKLFNALGASDQLRDPLVVPAPKVWIPEGDSMVEYAINLGGHRGYQLIQQTANVVGKLPRENT